MADTKPVQASPQSVGTNERFGVASTAQLLYQTPTDALKAVREDYLYWTGKLTDTSIQLSYAVIAANWAVFGSAHQILASFWSKLSVAMVIVALGVNLAGAKCMGELHRSQISDAESDRSRWDAKFAENAGKSDPWPFTKGIESLGRVMREAKTWLPLIAGILFLIALARR